MSEALKKPNPSTPESYSPKNKPEILNMVENVKGIEMLYPTQYRIKQKSKTAAYTGAGWPHSNAYLAMFSAISLFYGKESRLNEKREQVNGKTLFCCPFLDGDDKKIALLVFKNITSARIGQLM